MATSGSISKSGSWATATLSWSRTSVDIANNKSVISYTFKLDRDYTINSSTSKDYSVVINGSTVASGTTTIGGSGTKTIKTGSVTIPHNSDGTKTFSFSFSLEMNVTLSDVWVGTLSNSGSSTLDSIARTSQITVNDSTINYGSAVTIYTNRASSGFTHTLRYNWNGNSGTIATGVGTSYAWTVPNSFMSYIPNATSTTGTIYCDTYSGSTKIGTDSIKISTYVPSTIVPSFTSLTHAETVTTVSTNVGAYVQGLSKIKFTINGATGTYSSTISSYRITFDGATYTTSSPTTGAIKGSGSLTATATITDSRGRTASKSVSVTILAYSAPSVTAFSSTRSNSDGTINEVGAYASITRSASVSSLLVGATQKNTLTYTIKTKPRSGTTWTTNVASTTLATGTLSLSGTSNIGTFDITTSYDLRIEVTDKFNTTISLGVISTGQVTMSWGATGIGVGKVWESGGLDIRGVTNIEVPANNFGGLTITNPSVGYDPTIELVSPGGAWSIRNDDSNNNLFEYRWNNVRKVWINTGGTIFGQQVGAENPTNGTAQVYLGFNSDVPRIRYGGSGAGAASGFEIHGTGDNIKFRVDDSGNVQAMGGTFKATGNVSLVAETGYALVRSNGASADMYLQVNSEVRCVAPNTTATYRPILASAFSVNSVEDAKENIEEYDDSALEIVKRRGKVYKYDLIVDANHENRKNKYGFVIGREVPEEVLDYKGEAVDLYAMNSVLWKAVQELSEQVEYLSMKLKRR